MKAMTASIVLSIACGSASLAGEIAPVRAVEAPGGHVGRYSDATISVAIEVDRDGAALLAYTRKARPFERAIQDMLPLPGERAALDVALLGPGEARYTRRVPIQGICFEHDATAPAHVEGDTIRLHRESYIIEVPEIAGFDRLEVAREAAPGSLGARVPLGVLTLTPERFTAAGGGARYEDLAFASVSSAGGDGPATASAGAPAAATLTPGTVHWPEEFSDPDVYTLWGNAAEQDKRINIVLVPDGYTYADKATMQAHAQSMVTYFRNKTPYAEHDPFINYILVYAYSTQNGTDQCDCGIVRDTAMATRFPLSNPTCGHTENRCLFYGSGNGGPDCDPNVSTANLAAAELRAPAHDKSIVMVNTTRYGGCGGSRAVYSAGNGSATEVAVHELGHSLAGLADEYTSNAACGFSAGEVNTSTNGVDGAWPEWIGDLGAPVQGAQYYTQCVYRPAVNCVMRALNLPFCSVCRQQWALRFFGHFRINPTAPIASLNPAPSLSSQVGLVNSFSVATRLASGVSNSFEWKLQGPGFPTPTTVSIDGPFYAHAFSLPGSYVLTLDLIADTNFVKKQRYGVNRDIATWYVEATAVPEVSDDATHQLALVKNGANVDLSFEDAGSTNYNLYVSTAPSTLPFEVASPSSGKKVCTLAGVGPAGPGLVGATNVDLGDGITGDTRLLCVLVTADNGPGTEGSLGHTSGGASRTADDACHP